MKSSKCQKLEAYDVSRITHNASGVIPAQARIQSLIVAGDAISLSNIKHQISNMISSEMK